MKLGESSPLPGSRRFLDKMKLESPLHRTIPESIAKNSDLIVRFLCFLEGKII